MCLIDVSLSTPSLPLSLKFSRKKIYSWVRLNQKHTGAAHLVGARRRRSKVQAGRDGAGRGPRADRSGLALGLHAPGRGEPERALKVST